MALHASGQNRRIPRILLAGAIYRALEKVLPDKIIADCGGAPTMCRPNTSAASVPLALAVAVNDGRIKPGNLVLVEAMGGGFTWGSALIRW
jgi:hypothetical protein